ncbi:hypothetical protein F5B21DRAFT_493958 [Xylaria acuta]|nr:hypothetical protein F5B21DRAFT_493958 [Xylaria acuta]
MSGLELVPVIIAAVELGIKLINIVIEEIEKHDKLKENAQHFHSYSLSIDKDRLETDKNLARLVTQDPKIRLEEKQNLKQIFERVNQTLKNIEENLKLYKENAKKRFGDGRSLRKQALSNLEDRSRELAKDLNVFHDKVVSLSLISTPKTENLLSRHDFTITVPPRSSNSKRTWLTTTAFIATGRLARKIGDVEPGKQDYLLEYKSYKALEKEEVKLDMVLLNQHLVAAKNTEGIPKVLGFRDEPETDGSGEFHLVTLIPNISRSVQTLQKCLRTGQTAPSLNEKIALCANLAEAVLHTHRLGLVHKNIRPENILLVPDPTRTASATISGKAYLIGWPFSRQTENYQTEQVGEDRWDKRIYQHPRRQGRDADSEYCMGHDVYSLGVCMLEILHWKPLVQNESSSRTVSKDFEDAFLALGLDKGEVSRKDFQSEAEWITADADNVKEILMAMTKKYLPVVTGERIASTVTKCLTCLGGETDDEVEANVKAQQAQDPKEVGAGFVDDVLQDIRSVASAI